MSACFRALVSGCIMINGGPVRCAPTDTSFSKSICPGDTFYTGNHGYTLAGNYADTLSGAGGCDSIIHLSLTVNPLPAVTLCWDSMMKFGGFQQVNGNGDTTLLIGCGFGIGKYVALHGGHPGGGFFSGYAVTNDSINTQLLGGPDTIYYTYTDNHGCSATAFDTVQVFVCGGINPVNYSNPFSLYPNPANTFTMIDFDASFTGALLQVNDITGRQLLQIKLTSSPQQLQLTNLPAGLYAVVLNAEEKAITRLLVKE
jgi:Secretion system C-terminal sorting domain